jgi:hypothetical protein
MLADASIHGETALKMDSGFRQNDAIVNSKSERSSFGRLGDRAHSERDSRQDQACGCNIGIVRQVGVNRS